MCFNRECIPSWQSLKNFTEVSLLWNSCQNKCILFLTLLWGWLRVSHHPKRSGTPSSLLQRMHKRMLILLACYTFIWCNIGLFQEVRGGSLDLSTEGLKIMPYDTFYIRLGTILKHFFPTYCLSSLISNLYWFHIPLWESTVWGYHYIIHHPSYWTWALKGRNVLSSEGTVFPLNLSIEGSHIQRFQGSTI